MKLSVKDLTKTYDNSLVLDHVNIEVEGVKSIGIIGESGGGKSTFLRMLIGIETPDSGTISINELSPQKDKEAFYDSIGVVFQKHNLFPHLTVKENITLILQKIKKRDKVSASEKVDKLLCQLHIQNEANKKPSQISGGQAQRASIARALSTDPQVVFLDEPTAALDPILTEEVLKAVVELKEDGREFIFVTHEIEFLKEFADYVIFLKDGKICEQGDKSCLYNPKTEALAKFLKLT